jgi:SpoU rRNA methylase family enzyme
MMVIYAGIYSPTSVQRVVDFVRIVYAFPSLTPVVIKPVGAAAQIGVPEAFKISIKLNKPLIVIPELNDAMELLKLAGAYYYSDEGEELELSHVLKTPGNHLIVLPSGESEPSKKELVGVRLFKLKDIPPQLPPLAILSILMYKLFYQMT